METLVAAAHAKLVAYPILYAFLVALTVALVWIVVAVDAVNRDNGRLSASLAQQFKRNAMTAKRVVELERTVEALREDLDEFQTEYDADFERVKKAVTILAVSGDVHKQLLVSLCEGQRRHANELARIRQTVYGDKTYPAGFGPSPIKTSFAVIFPFERG